MKIIFAFFCFVIACLNGHAQDVLQDSIDHKVSRGDWENALQLINIKLNSSNLNNVDRAILVSLLGHVNLKVGNYHKVEYNYETAIKLLDGEIKAKNGFNFRSNAVSRDLVLLRLATFYKEFNLNILAINYCREACINMGAWIGKESPYALYSLAILAELYQLKGSLTHAKKLNLEALTSINDSKRIVLKEDQNLNYLTKLKILINLALIYNELKVKEKAFEYVNLAFEYSKNTNVIISESARTQHTFGVLYINSKDYQKAKYHLEKSLEIFRHFKEDRSYYFTIAALDLILVYDRLNLQVEAESLLQEVNKIEQNKLFKVFDFGSEFEQTAFLNGEDKYYSTVYSLALKNRFTNETLQETSCNISLLVNGVILNAGQTKFQSIENVSDKNAKDIYKRLQYAKSNLATQYLSPELQKKAVALISNKRPKDAENIFGAPYFRGLTELEFKVEQLEKELIRSSIQFDSSSQSLSINWQNIKQNLSSDEAAIQFIRFPYFNSDSVLYAAFIMRKEYKSPKIVPLFEEKQLNRILSKSGSIDKYINKLYSITDNSLYKLIWQPIDSLLNGVNKVWYVPAGKLNQISFAAIPLGLTKSLLSDKYSLNQIINIRLLLQEFNKKERPFTNITAALFGGIEYSEDSISLLRKTWSGNIANWEQKLSLNSNNIWFKLDTWSQIDDIKDCLSSLKTTKLKIFLDTAATEENFKSLSNQSPRFIHLATHGFYFSTPEKNSKSDSITNSSLYSYISASSNPLLRSGVILAGANYTWVGGKYFDNIEDGILTAYEVSSLDLSNTDLVVLSACETGLGDIHNREGVYGLQRAFKQAGVRYLLITLWEIPEEETNEFISKFYFNLVWEKSIRIAFKNTQQFMKDKYKKKFFPFNWAGFVLLE